MGKTYRRKDITESTLSKKSKARFQSDAGHEHYNGIEPEVKDRKNEIARMEKRKIKQRVLSGVEVMYDKTDRTVKRKSNTGYQYS